MQNTRNGQASGSKQTLVEEGTVFKGSFESDCPVVVKGTIQGDVSAPSLTVASTGAVHGNVKVGEIRSEGELSGEFEADLVQLSGRVKDNTIVRARQLEVKLSPVGTALQVVFGECEVNVGEPASKSEALATAAERAKDDQVNGEARKDESKDDDALAEAS
jgi:cytoskeletal protein CcmA (bactofilin family)